MKSTTSPEYFEEAARARAIGDMGEGSKSEDGTLRAIGADEVLSGVHLANLIEASRPDCTRLNTCWRSSQAFGTDN
jgi:hypothetical protein